MSTVTATVTDAAGGTATATADLQVAAQTVVYGSSGGGGQSAQAATIALLHPKILRTYDGGQRDAAPKTLRQCLSATRAFDIAKLTGGDPATVASIVGYFRALPDIPGQYACPWHERENDAGATVGEYRAMWAAFLALIPQINTGRANPVRSVSIVTGSADLTVWGDVGADVAGCDPYSTKALQRFVDWLAGRPGAVCEWGYGTEGVVAADDVFLARMQSDTAIAEKGGLVFFLLYNARANSLSDPANGPRPKATAFWQALTRA